MSKKVQSILIRRVQAKSYQFVVFSSPAFRFSVLSDVTLKEKIDLRAHTLDILTLRLEQGWRDIVYKMRTKSARKFAKAVRIISHFMKEAFGHYYFFFFFFRLSSREVFIHCVLL